MAVRRRRQVELFSFSFVDILATTIGVLLFILLMAVLNQSGVTEYAKMAKKVKSAETQREEAARQVKEAEEALRKALDETRRARENASGRAAGFAMQAQEMAAEREKQRAANEAAQARIRALKAQKDELEKKNKSLSQTLQAQQAQAQTQTQTPAATGLQMLPKAKGGAEGVAVHVDCRKDGLVILGSDVTSGDGQREFCPLGEIPSSNSAFGKLVQRTKRSSGQVLVLWVRPDGVASADKAIKAARGKVPLGWEPADKDWTF